MCGWFRGVLQVAGADTEQTVRHVVVNGWKGASPHQPLQEGSGRSVSDSFCTPGLRKIALGFRVGMHDVSWCGVASVRFSRKLASLPTCSMLTRIRRCFSVTMCGWFRGVLQVAGADTEQTVRHVVVNGWKGASPHEPLQEGSEPGQLVAF